MTTLFQLYSPIDTLKATTRQLASLWQTGDKLLLLADTIAYIDWLYAYVDEHNFDAEDFDTDADENTSKLDISKLYILAEDLAQLTKTTITHLNLDNKKVQVLSQEEWVKLTLEVDKVVTL